MMRQLTHDHVSRHTHIRSQSRRPWHFITPWAVAGLAMLTLSLAAACGGSDDAEETRSSAAGGAQSAGSVSEGGFDMDTGAAGAPAEEARPPADTGGFANGGDGAAPIADVLGRQVIRNGSVDLTVASVADAFEEVRQLVRQAGGYVSASTFTGREESQQARLTLRVPADQFEQLVADLRGIAVEVNSISTGSQDVTEEFTDLQASLRNYEALEQQYLTLLSEAEEIGDILQVQDRLSNVRFQIERVQGRLNLLDDLVNLATLEVRLLPESDEEIETAEPGFGDRIGDAWGSSLDTLAAIGTGIAVAIVWSWWLIPFILAGLVLLRRYAGRWPRRASRVDTPEDAA